MKNMLLMKILILTNAKESAVNIDAKSHLSSVSDEDAERIRKEAKNTNKTKQNNVKKDSKKLADSKGATPVIIRREVIVEDTTKKSAIPEKTERRRCWRRDGGGMRQGKDGVSVRPGRAWGR